MTRETTEWYPLILKMKSIFKIRPACGAVAVAVAVLAAGCGRSPQALVPAPPDGGDAQRLVTVLDYVSSDYARAVVPGGTVVSADEYEEQVKFVGDARALVASVLRPAPGASDPLVAAVARVEEAVQRRANRSGGVSPRWPRNAEVKSPDSRLLLSMYVATNTRPSALLMRLNAMPET